jgi:hypothetical protein
LTAGWLPTATSGQSVFLRVEVATDGTGRFEQTIINAYHAK